MYVSGKGQAGKATARGCPARGTAAARLRDLAAAGQFRALLAGQILSAAGDQVARVALTVLVYDRTQSPLWTALSYASSYMPWLIGGLVLSGLADRLPRRAVLITCDLARCGLVAVMTAPGIPLAAMVILLAAAAVAEAPAASARSAAYADILPARDYPAGIAVVQASGQAAAVAGFACGGLAAAAGVKTGLLADAATFAVSAALVAGCLRSRPPARPHGEGASLRSALRLVFGDRVPRTWLLYGMLGAFYSVPAALAVPYAAGLGGGPGAAGLVYAAGPLGAAAGSAAAGILASPARQARWVPPMAVAASLVLVLCAIRLSLGWSLLLLAASGAFSAYQVAANAGFVAAVPADRRAAAFGIAGAAILAGEGAASALGGLISAVLPPRLVIAAFGAAGAAAAALAARNRRLHHQPATLPARDQQDGGRRRKPPCAAPGRDTGPAAAQPVTIAAVRAAQGVQPENGGAPPSATGGVCSAPARGAAAPAAGGIACGFMPPMFCGRRKPDDHSRKPEPCAPRPELGMSRPG